MAYCVVSKGRRGIFMQKCNVFFMAAAALAIAAQMAAAQVWDGTTTDIAWYNTNAAKDTLYVSNGQELAGMTQLVNNAITDFTEKTIILTSDIDLDNKNWTPIGDNSTTAKRFAGVFDGNGKTISNLSVSGVKYAGLFGYVGTNGQIKNLTVNVKKITTSTGSTYAGGLAGYYSSTKTIENCGVNIADSIYASAYDPYSGGLVGYGENAITISNSYTTGNVDAYNSYSNSYSTSYSGGLVGYGKNAITISNSYTTGNVDASNSSSYSSSSSYSGGLVGYGENAITISNSYTTGKCSAFPSSSSYSTSYSGGLVGYANSGSNITNCYASGTITATGKGTKYIGGIFGRWGSGTNTSVYYNSAGASNAAGSGSPTGILGMSLEQLKKQATFFNWDFNGTWEIAENYSTPFLKGFPAPDVWMPKNDIEITHIFDRNYTGAQIKPAVKVRLKSENTVLTENVDYEVLYGANRNVSTGGTILIAGTGAYQGISETLTFKIIPKDLNVSGATAQNKVYDGTTAAKLTITGINGAITNDDVFVKDTVGTFASKDVGTAKAVSGALTLGGDDAGNYKIIQPSGLSADITKRDLIISLNPKITTIALSDDVPDLSLLLSYDGLQGEDTKAVVSGNISVSSAYVKGTSPAGNYPITLSGLVLAGNYNISYDNAGLALVVGDGSPIRDIQKSDGRVGIRLSNNVVSQKAEFEVVLPNKESVLEVKVVIYDNTGNVVFETSGREAKISWNLTNGAGRNVANGGYLIVAEARGAKGTYAYSAKVGVKR